MTLKTRLARCVLTEDWNQAKALAVLILEGVDDSIDQAKMEERKLEHMEQERERSVFHTVIEVILSLFGKPKSDEDFDSFYKGNFR